MILYQIQQENLTRQAGSPVLVMVFYEALCPDSKNFIVKQLHSAYERAPSLIDIQFVPYGKATVIPLTSFVALFAAPYNKNEKQFIFFFFFNFRQ